jgi:hypothetical protein
VAPEPRKFTRFGYFPGSKFRPRLPCCWVRRPCMSIPQRTRYCALSSRKSNGGCSGLTSAGGRECGSCWQASQRVKKSGCEGQERVNGAGASTALAESLISLSVPEFASPALRHIISRCFCATSPTVRCDTHCGRLPAAPRAARSVHHPRGAWQRGRSRDQQPFSLSHASLS